MRSVFNETLLEIAKKDPRIFMILADIGYGEIEPFAEAFPDRFFNVGVAEQNMTGVACGVAMEGNIAITYSIANFPTLRPLEQIRNDVCYHNANVKIVIIGGGLAYGALGISHHSTEDIAIIRALPNIVVVAPSDFTEARAATKAMIEHDGRGVFELLETPFEATRYHSLIVSRDSMPDCLEVTAWCDDLVMGVRHKEYPVHGVQFHPESILTEGGKKLLGNFLAMQR